MFSLRFGGWLLDRGLDTQNLVSFTSFCDILQCLCVMVPVKYSDHMNLYSIVGLRPRGCVVCASS